MSTKAFKNIAYSQEHIDHIKKILVRNQGTIENLIKKFLAPGARGSMDLTLTVSAAEIATCIRILETEYSYVGR